MYQEIRRRAFARTTLFTILVCLLAASPCAHALFRFVDVSEASGIGPYTMPPGLGAGASAADFDEDGDIDIFVPNDLDEPDQLYVNLGTGLFEDRAALLGVASMDRHRAALWLDYDGDQILDLVVAGDCEDTGDENCLGTIALYRQTEEGAFEDVTLQAGDLSSSDMGQLGGMAAGDINGDGFLDLIMTSWRTDSKLFLNKGDGTFEDITLSSGIGATADRAWQAIFHDFNDDGLQDVYMAVDFAPDRLWINQGDNTFINEAAASGIIANRNEMGVAPGDYDNDTDMDLFVTNTNGFNRFHRNDSVGGFPAFTDVAVDRGVNDSDWSWGCTFLDANNDTFLDLAVTNGFFEPPNNTDHSAFFLSQGGSPVAFDLVSEEVGFRDRFWGSSLIALDYNRDGRLDLLQTVKKTPLQSKSLVRLMQNVPDPEEPATSALGVRPRQDGPNHWAIGSIVRVTTGAVTMSRLITAGTSFIGQEPAEAYFGLAEAEIVDVLTVEWPDGFVSQFEDIAINQIITVTRDGFSGDPFTVADAPPDPTNEGPTTVPPGMPVSSVTGLAFLILVGVAGGAFAGTRRSRG
jgi:hypothetical protein